jgi:hypothetical protein
MMHRIVATTLLAGFAFALPAAAQTGEAGASDSASAPAAVRERPTFRAPVFEDEKKIEEGLSDIRVSVGGSFMQVFQNLSHSNTAAPVLGTDGNNVNELADIGAGFTLAAANLNLNAQLSPGIKVVVETYLSSRHHNEAWVKGGYLQIDESPIALPVLERVMEHLTLKIGHYGVNYGDAHYRRTDNGNTVMNPFVENLVLDAFTTEIGGEVIGRAGPFIGVFGITNGQNKGDITRPDERSWAFLGKIGFEQTFSDGLRARLTASTYQNDNAGRATLYGGDRAGSVYWGVLDNSAASAFTNGRVNPNLTEEIQAYQVNPFLQIGNLELFGVAELARGRTQAEVTAAGDVREVWQYAGDAVYRLLGGRLYAAGRYNVVDGELMTVGSTQNVDRLALAAGWFVTPNVLLKGEYVRQTFDGWDSSRILSGAKFDGLVVQGAVTF